MSETGIGVERVRSVVTKHRGARSPGGVKRAGAKTVRIQLHLGERVPKRRSAHAALVGRNAPRVANDILGGWLCRSGKGREIFNDDPGGRVTGPPQE